MNQLKNLIGLAKEFNSMVDKGESLEIKDLVEQLKNKQLFSWLEYRFRERINLETFKVSDLERNRSSIPSD